MKAKKANREYSISADEKKHYTDLGFDIYDDSGKKIASGGDEKVEQKKYDALKKKYDNASVKIAELKKEIAELKEAGADSKEGE